MVRNRAVAQQIQERDYTQKDRDQMDASDFAGPHQSFPILTQQDVDNAARLIGHADDPDAVKRRVIAIAKRKGFTLPDAWKSEQDVVQTAKEAVSSAAAPVSAPSFQPKARIARIKSYFLEDDAISLNGRKYPREAVDRLIQSAQKQLSDPDGIPLTCYLSHDHADADNALSLVGRITDVGREGKRAYAWLDVPDTSAGRDMATLVAGGYVRTQSLRASGAELRLDKESAFPLVGGSSLKLEGIDFTTSPGLPQVARITDVVLESHAPDEQGTDTASATPHTLQEVFHSSPSRLLLEQETHSVHAGHEDRMSTTTEAMEAQLTSMTSGVTQGMDDANPVDAYAQQNYSIPPGAPRDVFPTSLNDVHDHLATALGLPCAPGTMERAASLRFLGIATEAGAKFAMSTKQHLMAAHDGVAKHLGMECAPNGGMQADNNINYPMVPDRDMDGESTKKKTMTAEDAAKLLQEAGYIVQPPKTEAQLLREQMEALQKQIAEQQAAFAAQLEETRKAMVAQQQANQPVPQRRSLVEGVQQPPLGTTIAENPRLTRKRSFVREQLQKLDPHDLIDESRPLPEWLNPDQALGEYGLQLLGLMDAMYPMS